MVNSEVSYRAQWAQRLVREKLSLEINALKALRDHENNSRGPALSALNARARALPDVPLGSLFDVINVSPNKLPEDRQPARGEVPATPPAAPDGDLHSRPHNGVPQDSPRPGGGPAHPTQHRICIVGAGVTGLYIAMILDSLKIPGLTYDILEASERTGGRLFTHYFSDIPHDYYDIGAMRFPQIKIMDRTFDLFKRLDIPLIKYYLNSSQGALNYPTMYNDITVLAGEETGPDPYRMGTDSNGSVPADTVDRVDELLEYAFGPFKKAMGKNFEKGFQKLMNFDSYSTREFLKTRPPPDLMEEKLDFFTIQWLETNNTSSGLFDQAFSESVIDSFDFDAPGNGQDATEQWVCIDGGTSLVSQRMEEKIQSKPQHNKRVRRVTQDGDNRLTVEVVGEDKPREPYDTVFNTTSLACLQRVDLTGLTLHPSQKEAIRSLHYDDSAKVAIKFSYPWWITECGITKGGVGSTDIPLRTCVYPSYNIDDPTDKPAILLCSYTWSQDATRIGSLIDNRASPANEAELLDLMLDNLARLHQRNFDAQCELKGLDPLSPAEVRAKIGAAYQTHHAFSWSHDPYTSGAFALFGPGQFSNLYPYLSRPAADGRFHFAGEASSAHHAWIVGSLDSALASVHRYLRRFAMWEYIWRLEDLWGTAPEVEADADGTLHLQVALSALPEKYMVQV